MSVCGVIHFIEGHSCAPDDNGCVLPDCHDGPHEFVSRDGGVWQWETDMDCDCDHCMKCEGDYCTVYWRKSTDGKREVGGDGK